jgi:hypothetical protein
VWNGVGGRTVAEAKERMTFREARAWAEYLRLSGYISDEDRELTLKEAMEEWS